MKRMEEGEQGKEGIQTLPWRLTQLKKQIQASRLASIKGKLVKNQKSLEVHSSQLHELAISKRDLCIMDQTDGKNMLSHRIGSPLCKFRGSDSGSGEREIFNSQEELLSSGIVFGHNGNGKSLIRLIKLPFVEKIPPYTTWIFLDRNQRMAEDQSVVGRRQIYYDQYGGETIICSDSEEEFVQPDEEKHEFSEGEDQILWKALHEHGLNQEVLNVLSQFIDATLSEIKERYQTLLDKCQGSHVKNSESSGQIEPERKSFLNKTLNVALDSFDNLFCRRCLIFDCRLHGCSQMLIIPSEKQSSSLGSDKSWNPCGDQCYLNKRDVQDLHHDMSDTGVMLEMESVNLTEKIITPPSEAEDPNPGGERNSKGKCRNLSEPVVVSPDTAHTSRVSTPKAIASTDTIMLDLLPKNVGKRKVFKHENMPGRTDKSSAEKLLGSADKKQKKILVPNAFSASEDSLNMDLISITDSGYRSPASKVLSSDQSKNKVVSGLIGDHPETDRYHDSAGLDGNNRNATKDEADGISEIPVAKNSSSSYGWNPIEKDLYLKGVEIFGKNSCLIARNLLSGLKTCMEVANYMFNDGASMLNRPVLTNTWSDDNMADTDYMEVEMTTRTRIWRRRGRTRKLKYTWKSAGHPSFRKRIADGKEQSCKQYVPCGCKQMCGKKCPCLHNGTCCEKYCGCSKSCKNRFRGCHCAKSQCRSRQCPCFAAGRECDPDVCRNCWVSCGDGLLGEPPGRGDGYQCGNMKLLLKQQQRILLGKSDVAGWGAFTKNPVNKNDYLGEYTGELISHKEADKRGKIYDRANSSFLFDLNDQYVLDAYRKGDKLKFANHSSNPNCYAKVMLVAGDHRVGIFAKEHIEASEELFYDYRYGPDQAPAWAKKPEGSKRDDSAVSHGRAQKIA